MMKNGFQGKNALPDEWNAYQFCETFGWTHDQYMDTDTEIIAKFIEIGNIKSENLNKK